MPRSKPQPLTSVPSTMTRPSLAVSSPMAMRSAVVLPHPLGPISATISPSPTVKLKRSSARTVWTSLSMRSVNRLLMSTRRTWPMLRPRGGVRRRPFRRGEAGHALGLFEPHAPILPCPRDGTRPQIIGAGALALGSGQRFDMAERVRAQLLLGVAADIDGAEHELVQRGPSDRGAVSAHQHDPVGSERARQGCAFLGLDHQQIGVAEIVTLVPERRLWADGAAQVIDRKELGAGNAERQDRG